MLAYYRRRVLSFVLYVSPKASTVDRKEDFELMQGRWRQWDGLLVV